MGVQTILNQCVKHIIVELNLSENMLDMDGAKNFCEFLEFNKTLQVLKVNNCGLGSKSCELMFKALSKNKDMKLIEKCKEFK